MTAASKPGTTKSSDTLSIVPFPFALSRCRYAYEYSSHATARIPLSREWCEGMREWRLGEFYDVGRQLTATRELNPECSDGA